MKKTIISIVMAFMLSFCLNISSVFADNEFNITGDFTDKLRVTADNTYIFQQENVMPGDSWVTNINITNDSKKKIDVTLTKIINNNESILPSQMYLILCVDGNECYNGDYETNMSPIISSISLDAKETKKIVAICGVYAESSNSIQNSKLESTWIFDCTAANNVADNLPTKTYSAKSGTISNIASGVYNNTYTTDLYTVICYDESGNIILKTQLSPSQNNSYLFDAPDIEGYTADSKYKSIFSLNEHNEITFKYLKEGGNNLTHSDLSDSANGLNEETTFDNEYSENFSSYDEANITGNENTGSTKTLNKIISFITQKFYGKPNNKVSENQRNTISENVSIVPATESDNESNSNSKHNEGTNLTEIFDDISSNTKVVSWIIVIVLMLVIALECFVVCKIKRKK